MSLKREIKKAKYIRRKIYKNTNDKVFTKVPISHYRKFLKYIKYIYHINNLTVLKIILGYDDLDVIIKYNNIKITISFFYSDSIFDIIFFGNEITHIHEYYLKSVHNSKYIKKLLDKILGEDK